MSKDKTDDMPDYKKGRSTERPDPSVNSVDRSTFENPDYSPSRPTLPGFFEGNYDDLLF